MSIGANDSALTPTAHASGAGRNALLQRRTLRSQDPTEADRLDQQQPTDPRLYIALAIAAVFHGGLLVAGSFRRTYDAYVHLFFADHYADTWFSTWEPRWYTGFTTVSYPPGSHQFLALTSKVVGLGFAFPIVAFVGVLMLTLGVYRFSRIWVGPRAAGYAAILLALSSSIAEALHTFGQLPTVMSLGMLLNALPFAHRWMVHGHQPSLVAGIACSLATTAFHHVTTLFGSVFFLGPVMAHALLTRLRMRRLEEPDGHEVRSSMGALWPLLARRLRRVLAATLRTGLYGGLVLVGLVSVVLPYWLWSSSDPILQISIPHASRDNFLENTNAGLVFWLIPWGFTLVALPYAFLRGLMSRAWPLMASVGLLAVLGTGGTTPIPRMILGGAFDVLTLDRFTLWATIAVLPMVGHFVESLVHGRVYDRLSDNIGRFLTRAITVGLGVATILTAIFAANLGQFRPMQPPAIDMDPIVSFLKKDQHDRWRYLTLGFGDQMAWLGAQTNAESVDGNYHSARRLPELTSFPVERLEGAKYSGVPGIGSLQQFLAIPEKYHLKYVFSNDQFYDPLLWASGWDRIEPLRNGIAVWQREDIEPLPAGRLRKELPAWQRLMWGTLPVSAIAFAYCSLALHAAGRRITRGRPLPRVRAPWFVKRRWEAIDIWLAEAAARAPIDGPPPVWQIWRQALERFRAFTLRPVGKNRRIVQSMLVLAALAGAAFLVVGETTEKPTPEQVVYSYYDAVDLRFLGKAYDILDPTTRPSLDQYLVEQSVVNGLVASYARLDRITSRVVDRRGDYAVVASQLTYITALDEFEVQQENVVHLVDGEWKLSLPEVDIRIPPDQLVTRTGIDYLSQGRRQVTAGTTAYQDVLDRPEIHIISARLVEYGDQLAVVGELRNDDVDPAHVTINADLVGFDDKLITTYTAATFSAHTALPGEIVPFRIDFEAIAGADGTEGATDLIFDPTARTSIEIDPATIAKVQLYGKAVVTAANLDRSLVAQSVDVDEQTDRITGWLRADGINEITVPTVIATLRDENGNVGWVDRQFQRVAIRPQRSEPFTINITPANAVTQIDVEMEIFTNGIAVPSVSPIEPLVGSIAGWTSADLTLVGFLRAER
jgi:hypothetical protein